MMRRVVPILLALALILAAGSASLASTRHKTHFRKSAAACRRGQSRVIVADTQAEVYKARKPDSLPEYIGVWGCAYGHAHPTFLGSLPECGGGGPCGGTIKETLTGPLVAYEQYAVRESESEWYVIVRDLRTGRVIHSAPTGTVLTPAHECDTPGRCQGVGPTTTIVLKSDGAVAWIAEDEDRSTGLDGTPEHRVYWDVESLDQSGSRLLASGFDIDPHSLALAGSTLYWTQAGKPFSAQLK
jgi:hypothetical protein